VTLGLLRAELLRLFSDRKVAVVAVLVLGIGFWISSSLVEVLKPYTALDWEDAQRQSNDAQINLDVICGSGTSGVDCSSLPWSVAVEGFLRPQLNFEQLAITTLGTTTQAGLFAVVVLITVMIGSEFNTGSIGTQLTFTPRRMPLLWAKVAASAICGVCLMVFWSVSMVGLDVFLFLNLRGAEGLVAGGTLAAQIGRALLMGAVMAALAATVTMALASTVRTWVLISAGLVLSQFLETSKNLAQIAGLLPTTNMLSLINGEWTRTIYNGEGVRQEPTPHIDYAYSLGYAVFWLVVFGIWASVSFSRRNILK
jgi:membrane protein